MGLLQEFLREQAEPSKDGCEFVLIPAVAVELDFVLQDGGQIFSFLWQGRVGLP